jgi:hypothetical protein
MDSVIIPTPIVVALIALLGGAIIAPLLAWWLGRDDNAAKLAHNAIGVANDTMTQLVDAKKEIAELREKMEALEAPPAVYVGIAVHPDKMEAKIVEVYPVKEV